MLISAMYYVELSTTRAGKRGGPKMYVVVHAWAIGGSAHHGVLLPPANIRPGAQNSAKAVREDGDKANLFMGTPLPCVLNQVPVIHDKYI
jgi:hypothetical protein